jgi:hypothetical protein
VSAAGIRHCTTLLLVAASTLTMAACASLSQIPVFTVSIVNDTVNPVVVRDCDDFCSSSTLVFDLQPGGDRRHQSHD